ncbi:DNA-binding CsgD family transcriptional regulator [Streptomyces sp. PvR006]|uniref:helix-turn-helix domain-containing protein n=1 Tax=Streptomyces sp. PvR006 TaxID=2817860 RepID=UPI001AEA7298|nr:helix-turn-helix transcriptional regulator [Streptomyces sp. PvR006]MBP2581884.1 DNA-binding CsgD family transcriptional regulator [Streptomyces sp. PvR006]
MPELTDTEHAVLRGAARGDTYAVIAARLGLHDKSVNKIAFRLARKLGARNITNAVLLACQAGILDGRPRRHGDHAGYEAHRKRGEDPKLCEPCRLGERAHRQAMKTRTRT